MTIRVGMIGASPDHGWAFAPLCLRLIGIVH